MLIHYRFMAVKINLSNQTAFDSVIALFCCVNHRKRTKCVHSTHLYTFNIWCYLLESVIVYCYHYIEVCLTILFVL